MDRGEPVRSAVADDATALSALATRVFRETYGVALPEAILAPYLARTFSPAAFQLMIADPEEMVWVAIVDGQLSGYAKLVIAPLPSDRHRSAAVELHTLYIDRQHRGSGLGKALLGQALAWAHSQEYAIMWLCVWQKNDEARTFYARLGFVIVGTTAVPVDGVVFHDWVMARPTTATDTVSPSPVLR